MMEMVMATGVIRRAKLQSNCHHQQTNSQLFTGFLSPNQQCQSTEGKISHSMMPVPQRVPQKKFIIIC